MLPRRLGLLDVPKGILQVGLLQGKDQKAQIKQRGRGYCVSQPAGQCIEPLIVEVHHIAREGRSCNSSASLIARRVKHVAEPNHPTSVELVITANLTAAGKPGTVARYRSSHTADGGVAKGTTNVAADVAAGPHLSHYWSWRERSRRSNGQVCG